MMNVIATPDEDTLLRLLQLLPEWRQRLISRGTLTQINDEGVPGLLIIKIPSSGLAAYSGTGMVPSCEGLVQQPKWVVSSNSPEIEGVSGVTGAFTQTVYNVLPNAFLAGDRILAGRLSNGGYFALGTASDGTTAGGAGCPCECFDSGDMILHGTETFDTWRVSLGEQRWPQQYGVIVLPAIDFDIVWDPIRQLWVLDIGDYLEAEYPDGSDASAVTVMDGEITMTWPDPSSGDCCLDAILQVCVQGTVPQQSGNAGNAAGFQYGYKNGYNAGAAGNPYNDTVIFSGASGLMSGPSGSVSGSSGSVSGSSMWFDYEQGFSQGYKHGYSIGYSDGQVSSGSGSGSGSTSGAGSGSTSGAGYGGMFE